MVELSFFFLIVQLKFLLFYSEFHVFFVFVLFCFFFFFFDIGLRLGARESRVLVFFCNVF